MKKKIPSHLQNKNATLRLNQSGLKKILGDLEAEIMEISWAFARPVTVRQVYEEMREQGKKLSYLTVMTVMNRLGEKGILKIVGVAHRANIFEPIESREHFLEMVTGIIVERLLNDFPEQMAMHFKKISQIECDSSQLEALAKKVEKRRKKPKEE